MPTFTRCSILLWWDRANAKWHASDPPAYTQRQLFKIPPPLKYANTSDNYDKFYVTGFWKGHFDLSNRGASGSHISDGNRSPYLDPSDTHSWGDGVLGPLLGNGYLDTDSLSRLPYVSINDMFFLFTPIPPQWLPVQ